MSIRDEISEQLAEGRLFLLPPLFAGMRTERTILASLEVHDIAQPPWPETWEGERHAEVRAYLDAFTEGRLISIAEEPYDKHRTAFLARVDPPTDEVWDIRCIDPEPGMRVLGCFAETDIFVALIGNYRENLTDARDWRDEIELTKAEWRKLFPTYRPHSGANLHDYVSRNWRHA